jgi:hypothetical protein
MIAREKIKLIQNQVNRLHRAPSLPRDFARKQKIIGAALQTATWPNATAVQLSLATYWPRADCGCFRHTDGRHVIVPVCHRHRPEHQLIAKPGENETSRKMSASQADHHHEDVSWLWHIDLRSFAGHRPGHIEVAQNRRREILRLHFPHSQCQRCKDPRGQTRFEPCASQRRSTCDTSRTAPREALVVIAA